MTSLATLSWIVLLLTGAGAALVVCWVIGVVMAVFPLLEAGFGFCVGCKLFALLARLGLVRPDVCVDCV
jgi:hypothetical protein